MPGLAKRMAFGHVGAAGLAGSGVRLGWWGERDDAFGGIDQRLATAVPIRQLGGRQRNDLVEVGEARVFVEAEDFLYLLVALLPGGVDVRSRAIQGASSKRALKSAGAFLAAEFHALVVVPQGFRVI